MEEMKCRECGGRIVASMAACPNCGCPTGMAQPNVQPRMQPNPNVQPVMQQHARTATVQQPVNRPETLVIQRQNEQQNEEKSVKKAKKITVDIMAIISLILGVVVIILGTQVMNKKADIDIETYTAKKYSVDSAIFGGDFYTEIYGASDVIVDELNDINNGIAKVSESIAQAAETAESIYYPAGMIIVAMGIGVVALSLKGMIKREYV